MAVTIGVLVIALLVEVAFTVYCLWYMWLLIDWYADQSGARVRTHWEIADLRSGP